MFLNRLNLEEKEAFIQLAHHVARLDTNFCESEQLMIDKYCMEMQMDDIDYDADSFDLNTVLDTFTTATHRKIALLEIMALIYSDGALHSAEETILRQMVAHFKLNPNLAVVYKEWAKGILSLFIQGEALVHL